MNTTTSYTYPITRSHNTRTVLVVAPYFPPHTGGLERYAHAIARRLHLEDGWEVVVITTSETSEDMVETIDGMTVHRMRIDRKFSNTPLSIAWYKKVRRILASVQPDVVHLHAVLPGLQDVLVHALDKSTPLVVTYHGGSLRKGSFMMDAIAWVYEHTFLRRVLARAQHIACPSDYVRTDFLSAYQYKSSTIRPAVDTELFVSSEANRTTHPSVLFVAGLNEGDRHKGLDPLMRAVATLAQSMPDVTLTVVGDGALRSRYEARVQTLAIAERVRFTGQLHGVALVAEYQKAHALVLPTINESFGMVLAESLACQTPVVSTNVGGVPSLVKDGVTGLLVKPDDHKALVAAMTTLLTDEAKRQQMGKAGRADIEARYSWFDRVAAYTHIYERVLIPMRNITHVCAYYPPHVGGLEVVAEEVAREEGKRGYQVEVFTTGLGARYPQRVEQGTNLRVHRLRALEFAHTPIMWTLLVRLLCLPKNTLLHVHLAHVLVPEIALLAAWVRGFTVVGQFHLDVGPSGRLGCLYVWYKKYILPRVLQRMDAVMVFTQDQEDFIVSTHGVSREKIHHVMNAVSDMFFRDRVVRKPHTPLRLLTLSRLTVQKRVDRLIEAMSMVTEPVELVIVGDGEDRDMLRALAEKLSLENVRFVGKKIHAEIPDIHAWADMFVIPSDREGGMPLNVLEAMAAGLPILGANTLGVRELVSGVGIVVEPTTDAFAEGITAIATNPSDLEMLSRQSVTCAREHRWPRAVDGIERVYAKVWR